MIIIDISNRALTTFEGIIFPNEPFRLDCWNNQLTSLEGCPKYAVKLNCSDNQLTSIIVCYKYFFELNCSYNPLITLEHLPSSVIIIKFTVDASNEYYKCSIKQIHKINRIKKFMKGINIVRNIIKKHQQRFVDQLVDDFLYKPDSN